MDPATPGVVADPAQENPLAFVLMTAVMSTMFVVAQFHRICGAVIATHFETTLGFGATTIGVVIGVLNFGSVAAQLFTGTLFDLYGVPKTVGTMALLPSLGAFIFGVSDDPILLVIGRVLIGVGFSGMVGGIYVFLLSWVSPRRFSAVASIALSLPGAVAAFVATLPLEWALNSVGRSSVFVGIAILTLLLGIGIRVLVREGVSRARPAGKFRDVPRLAVAGVNWFFRDAPVLRVAVCSLGCYAPFIAIGGLWAGPYLRDVVGLDQTAVGLSLFAMLILNNIGLMAIGLMPNWLGSHKRAIALLAIIAGMAIAPFAVGTMPSPAVAVALLLIFSVVTPVNVIVISHARSLTPQRLHGRLVGFVHIFMLSGTAFAQIATGLVASRFADPAHSITLVGFQAICITLIVFYAICLAIYAGVEDPGSAGERKST